MLCRIINKIFNTSRICSDMEIDYETVKALLENNESCVLIDVRSPQEYKEGHLEKSINLPLYNMHKNILKTIPDKESTIIVYCQSGNRSKKAIDILNKLGYRNLYMIKGGLDMLH